MLTPRTPRTNRLAVAACLCAAALGACSDSTVGSSSTAATSLPAGALVQSGDAQRQDFPALAPIQRQVTAHYDLVIFNARAVVQDMDQLDPMQGKGYQPLSAFIYLRGVPRAKSPVAGVKPVCASPTHCEYLPSRKEGYADRYVITIEDDAVAQLSTDEDVVVISAKQVGLTTVATVNVTLEVPGEKPLTKRIVYGPATS